jgi:protein gp37
MNKTPIGWTMFTGGFASGCEVEGPECKYCYAHKLAERRRGSAAFPNGFDYTERRKNVAELAKLERRLGGRGALVFANSTTDFWWSGFDPGYAAELIDAFEACPTLRVQVLTKRPGPMGEFFAKRTGGVPANVWIGVTCGHTSRVDRVDLLRQIPIQPSGVRFVSAEPLLSNLGAPPTAEQLGRRRPRSALDLTGISWLIVGGESGDHLSSNADELDARALVERGPAGKGWAPRADRVPWVRNLVGLAERSGVPLFFKQWGGPKPESAGRLLDGRTLDGMPTHIPGAMPPGYSRTLPVIQA